MGEKNVCTSCSNRACDCAQNSPIGGDNRTSLISGMILIKERSAVSVSHRLSFVRLLKPWATKSLQSMYRSKWIDRDAASKRHTATLKELLKYLASTGHSLHVSAFSRMLHMTGLWGRVARR